MSGDLQSVSSRQAARGEKAGDPAAARDVGLEAVDAAEQVAEVGRHVGVLAGRDLETGGRALAEEPQALEVRRADRLLEPAHVPLPRVALRPRERLLARESAARVDVELRLRADRLAHRVEPRPILLGPPAPLP